MWAVLPELRGIVWICCLLALGTPVGFSSDSHTVVSCQVSGVACDVLDEIRQSAGQGDLIEVHGDQWKGFRVACLLPADHRVNDITGCFAVSRWRECRRSPLWSD